MRRRASVFLLVLCGLVVYTGLQVGRLLPGGLGWQAWALTVGYFWLVFGYFHVYKSPGTLEKPWFGPLAWTASVLFGVWAGFLAFSLPLEAGGLLGALTPGPRTAAAAAAAAAALSAVGLAVAAKGPLVRRLDVPIAGLPAALDGLTIAHLTDLHVGPMIRAGYVERVARELSALAPDLIAFTGDMADGPVESVAPHFAALAGVSAPLGVYYVTGNHEYYWGATAWVEQARRLGMTPLLDESRLVERGGARVQVGGVCDTQGHYFEAGHRGDLRQAAAGSDGAALRILLAHRPDPCREAESAGFHLQLSGHTHGGQFFPFSVLIRLFHKHYRGLSREGRMWVYVNPGTGYWGPPHRFGVPAEIALLTLKSA